MYVKTIMMAEEENTTTCSPTGHGMVQGKTAKRASEGQYYMQVEATLDFEGAKSQSFTFPVKLDITSPKLKTKLEKDNRTITVDVSDKTSGVAYWYVEIDGKPVEEATYVNGEYYTFLQSLLQKIKPSPSLQ